MQELTRRECLSTLAGLALLPCGPALAATVKPVTTIEGLCQKHGLHRLRKYYIPTEQINEKWLLISTPIIVRSNTPPLKLSDLSQNYQPKIEELVVAADRWIENHPEHEWQAVSIPVVNYGSPLEDTREIFAYLHITYDPNFKEMDRESL